MRRFLVVIEKAIDNYSAYSPDLPGCVATGETREDVELSMHEAIQARVDGLVEDNLPLPEPESFAEYVASYDVTPEGRHRHSQEPHTIPPSGHDGQARGDRNAYHGRSDLGEAFVRRGC